MNIHKTDTKNGPMSKLQDSCPNSLVKFFRRANMIDHEFARVVNPQV
jgi:hypothetical protein